MIEYMEAESIEAPKKTSNTDNSRVAEEANVDEVVTAEAKASNDMKIYLKEERKTQSYKETMNIDIENISKFESKNKVCTTQWRKIYEDIEPELFRKYNVFPDAFMKKCKDIENEAINIPIEIKNNI